MQQISELTGLPAAHWRNLDLPKYTSAEPACELSLVRRYMVGILDAHLPVAEYVDDTVRDPEGFAKHL